MKKEERIIRILGQLPDSMLEEALEPVQSRKQNAKKRERFVRTFWMPVGIGAACLCLLAAGAGIWKNQSSSPWPVKKVPGANPGIYNENGEDSSNEFLEQPHWDDLSISSQYALLEWEGRSYNGTSAVVSQDKIDYVLGREVLSGQDVYAEVLHEREGDVFAVSGIAPQCAVAVELEGTYYVYRTSEYVPDTLGDLIEDLNLHENIQFGSVWYEYQKKNGEYASIEFTDLPQNIVWEMLLRDETLANVEHYDQMQFSSIMSISVNIPLIGYENIALSVTEEGYVTTNILDTGKAFFIGAEKVQKFVDYVLENCQGYEIVYTGVEEIPEGQKKEPDNGVEVEVMTSGEAVRKE